jgi:hypothetical protein
MAQEIMTEDNRPGIDIPIENPDRAFKEDQASKLPQKSGMQSHATTRGPCGASNNKPKPGTSHPTPVDPSFQTEPSPAHLRF